MPISPLAISAGAWLWDKYGKAVTDRATGAVKERYDRFKWTDAAEKYRAKIKKLYGTMQIMGMAKPVPLDDLFTDAYLLDKPTAFGRFDVEQLRLLSAHPDVPPRSDRINGLRLVGEKGNLFVLGKPGAGKTTFLKYIALKAAEQTIDSVPIFVALKEWADSGADLMQFIAERFDICDFPDAQTFVEELLKSNRAIVLFDGLDEVNEGSGQRDKQIRAMNNFIEKYDRVQCLITCRIAATDYSFKPFTYVEIADFTERQMRKFVGNWFRNYEGEKDERTSEKFLEEFAKNDNKGLRDLARTPLLLTLLCLVFEETMTFPQRRVEIYQEALDAMLKKWDSSRRIRRDEIYRKLSLGHKENMLSRVAAETFENNDYLIPQGALERYITEFIKNIPPHEMNEESDGEVILKAIEAQHGILVERAHRIYSYSHLTLQEFLTAKYIVGNAAKGTLMKVVKAHCTDDRWREVFLLTTSLLPDAGEFMMCLRQGVDELLDGGEKFRSLLEWANRKAVSFRTDPWQIREIYLSAELRELSLRDYTIRDRGLILDLNFTLTHNNLYAGFKNALLGAVDLGLDKLAKELAALASPIHRESAVAWSECTAEEMERFSTEFRALMILHRDIGHNWKLTSEQNLRLVEYLRANKLLRDCLDLALMSPDSKKGLLDSLYLPPSR